MTTNSVNCTKCSLPPRHLLAVCPLCDGVTIHAEGCTASLDPTLPATIGTRLQETADELERCWISLGQVKPNRHVTAARALLGKCGEMREEKPTAAEVTDALAVKFREAGFPDVDSCQQLLDILKDVEFIYTTPIDQPFGPD